MSTSSKQRRWRWLLAVTSALALLWLASSFLAAWWMTRRPATLFSEPPPLVAWPTFVSLRLATSDGEELGAWFHPGNADSPILLLLHGNGGSRSRLLPQAEMFAPDGFGLLLLTLRAHGDSTGARNDFGLSARLDVLAALAWLAEHQPGRKVVIVAQSLGAAAVLFAGPQLPASVIGVVLESPYRDLATAVWNRCDFYLPWGLSHLAYGGLRLMGPLFIDVSAISPEEAAGTFPAMPVLLLAGEQDQRARMDEVLAVQQRLRGFTQLDRFAEGDHGRLAEAEPDKYRSVVLEFIQRVTARKN